jgi:putative chitinase
MSALTNAFTALTGALNRVKRNDTPAPQYPRLIAMIDVDLLRVACPERTREQLEPWVEPIRKACQRFGIDNVRRIAGFISQMAHESSLIPGREENLNYSAKRLTQVWPSRFPSIAAAEPYARNPEKLANRVYANRMGNGPESSGDGWKFRGVGPGQLTGRDNMTRFAKAMGLTVDQALAFIRTIEGGVMSFAWFWSVNDLNRLADTPGVTDETRRINGGTHGLADREARFNRTVAALLAAGA